MNKLAVVIIVFAAFFLGWFVGKYSGYDIKITKADDSTAIHVASTADSTADSVVTAAVTPKKTTPLATHSIVVIHNNAINTNTSPKNVAPDNSVFNAISARNSSSGNGTFRTETHSESYSDNSVGPVKILQVDSKNEEINPLIHVQIENITDKLLRYVQLDATFYDKDGKIVGTGMGNTTNLAGGAHRTINIMGLDVENSARYEVQITEVDSE